MELALAGRRLYDRLVEELDEFEFRASGGMIYFFEDQHDLFPGFVEGRRSGGPPDGVARRRRRPGRVLDLAG